ncbi:MAG: tRNA (cytidine(34)-2'-O)-methyltransferase [Planctomycetaceae bacterium]
MPLEPTLHVVLHEPEIPPNTGNIGRTCVAIGAKLWLVRPLGFSLNDYYLRRAGLDYWEKLDWEAVDSWTHLLERLPREPDWLFSARASRLYTSVHYERGCVVVFGSETSGLPRAIVEPRADRTLLIPSRPDVRSLNLSNAAAIVCYEAVRQWGPGAIMDRPTPADKPASGGNTTPA